MHKEVVIMATVIIDTRTKEAKKMLEFLKSTRYARVIEEDIPNEETLEAMNEVEEGKVNSYKSAKDVMRKLKKKASVQDKDNP
jgi:D-arabinose 1-dehydrogenase-like Zn-dependent alcohol dehydrogenase